MLGLKAAVFFSQRVLLITAHWPNQQVPKEIWNIQDDPRAASPRLGVGSALRLLGERATSGVPSNHAPPRETRSTADAGPLPGSARAPSGLTEGQEGVG